MTVGRLTVDVRPQHRPLLEVERQGIVLTQGGAELRLRPTLGGHYTERYPCRFGDQALWLSRYKRIRRTKAFMPIDERLNGLLQKVEIDRAMNSADKGNAVCGS